MLLPCISFPLSFSPFLRPILVKFTISIMTAHFHMDAQCLPFTIMKHLPDFTRNQSYQSLLHSQEKCITTVYSNTKIVQINKLPDKQTSWTRRKKPSFSVYIYVYNKSFFKIPESETSSSSLLSPSSPLLANLPWCL